MAFDTKASGIMKAVRGSIEARKFASGVRVLRPVAKAAGLGAVALSLCLAMPAAQAVTVAYYDFEEGSDGLEINTVANSPADSLTVTDSGDGTNGLISYGSAQSPNYSATTVPNRTTTGSTLSMQYDGGDDLYLGPDTVGSASWATNAFTDFTIETFVNFSNLDGYQTMVGRDDADLVSGGGALFYLSLHDNDYFRVALADAAGTDLAVEGTSFTPTTDTWYHVAAVGNATAGTLELFVDGNSVGTTTGYTGLYDPTPDTIWTVGRGQWDGNPVDMLNGYLDDVRVSDVALNPSQFLFEIPMNQWGVDADGLYSVGTNWQSGSAPGIGEDVDFGLVISANRTVTLDSSVSINTLTFNNTGDGDYFIVDNGGGETLTLIGDATVNTTGRHWLRAEVAGTSGMTTAGNGELVLDATNSFSGGLNIRQTNVAVVNDGAIAAGNAIDLSNNGDLRFYGSSNTFFTGQGSAGFGTDTISDSVSVASGSILGVFDGVDLTLDGAVTANGVLSADNATLRFSNASTTTFNLADNNTSGSIVGAGTVELNGAVSVDSSAVTDLVGAWSLVNTATLNETFGANFAVSSTADGAFTEASGIWTNGVWAFNEASGLLSKGDVWAVDADGVSSVGSNWNSGVAPTSGASTNVLFSDIISANRTVTVDNGGAAFQVNSIVFDNPAGNGDYHLVANSNETFQLTGDAEVNITGRHWLQLGVAGTSGLNVTGPGELVLDAANSFTGGIVVDDANLAVTHADAIAAGNDITVQNTGLLRIWGPNNGFFSDNGATGYDTGSIDGNISISSGSDFRISDGATVAISGAIATDGTFDINGADVTASGVISGSAAPRLYVGANDQAASLTMSAANTYNGVTLANNTSVITLTGAGTLGASDGTAATGTTLAEESQLALDGIAVGNEYILLSENFDGEQAKIASSGNSSIAGNIHAGTDDEGSHYEFSSAAGGNLTLSGTVSAFDGAAPNDRFLVFSGDGNFIVSKITDGAVDADGNFSATSVGSNVTVIKRGAGTMTVATATDSEDDYWGVATIVEGGTLKVESNGSGVGELQSQLVQVKSGATLDVTAWQNDSANYNLGIGQELAGSGTVDVGTGALGIYDDNIVTIGDGIGTLTVDGRASITNVGGGGALNYQLGSTTTAGGTANDLLQINGTLTTSGNMAFNLNVAFDQNRAAAGSSTYTLASFNSSATPNVSGLALNVTDRKGNAVTTRRDFSVSSTSTAINLNVTGNSVSSTWNAASGIRNWDKGLTGTNNWTSSDNKFYDFDNVTFGTTGQGSVNVSGTVSPGTMTVSGGTYEFGGDNISAGTLTVSGASTVASFSNTVGGVVNVQSGGTLGGTATFQDSITVNNTGRLRIGAATMPKEVTVSGRLLENFDSYDNSSSTATATVTGGVWASVFDGTANSNVVDSTKGQSLETKGGAAWRGAVADLNSNWSAGTAVGETSTYFFQFNPTTTGGSFDVMMGLAPEVSSVDQNNAWQDFNVMPFFAGAADGTADLKATGPDGDENLITDATLGTWYNVWYVVHNDATNPYYEVWTSTGNAAGNVAINDAVWRNTTPLPVGQALNAIGFMAAGGEGSNMLVDNIWYAEGIRTDNPLVADWSQSGTSYEGEVLTIEGDLSLASGAIIEFDIATSGSNDSIDILGELAIASGAVLDVNLDSGLSIDDLGVGSSWSLFSYDTLSGSFDDFTLMLPEGLDSSLTWDLTDGVLSVIAAGLLGDFNGDGIVNLGDYTVWRDNLGADDSVLATGSTEDGSGIVDAADYATWKANFGATSAAFSGVNGQANVPEPSTMALLALAGCGLLVVRKRTTA
ncbi:hypothetical protein Pan181_42090 [Aeoliella mucimassa]|uniref:LamG-like jellyroll fold domain-containing protein n=2 Tax=Aeoliella mucimassa TaxID=2527972 RepID=A0A518ATB3_9BACT|nr:hypothetical protein Pan181_42090 [Aeoliella mucimassa]